MHSPFCTLAWQSPEEAQELRAGAIIAAWYSVADWSRGPIELVGSQWPYN